MRNNESMFVDYTDSEARSCVTYRPLSVVADMFEQEGYSLITLKQDVKLRMSSNPASRFMRNTGNFVLERALYVPGGSNLLTRLNLDKNILKKQEECYLQKYSSADDNKRPGLEKSSTEYYPGEKELEDLLKDSTSLPSKTINIPVNRLAEEEITNWCFEELSDDYGSFLKSRGLEYIKIMPLKNAYRDNKNHTNPFVRQIFFRDVNSNSDLFMAGSCYGGFFGLPGAKRGYMRL